MLAFSFACSARADSADRVSRTQNPLVASYAVAAPSGSNVAIEFGLNTSYGFSTSPVTVPAGVSSVSILVAGMKEHSTYHMRAVITHADGTKDFDPDELFQTGSIPTGRAPAIAITLRPGVNPSSGVELASLNAPQDNLGNPLRIVGLNPAGDVIWYYDFDEPLLAIAQPIKLLPNGHFLMALFNGTTGPGGEVREIDLAGRTIHDFTVDQLNQWLAAAGYRWTAHAIHHDILPLPNDHIIVLVNSEKKFNNGLHRHTNFVLGDALVDLDRNFKPVWTWSSFDHLDVHRHPMEFPDWTHTNAVIYSPGDGNLLLSLRHQHWVIKIDYANGHGTGNILWRLGYQGDFKLLNSNSPADWFFAQHYLEFLTPNSTGDFQLALFDNGNHRVLDLRGTTCDPGHTLAGYARPAVFSNGTPDCYGRPVILEVNETARTARILWSDQVPFSNWGGVTMQLPNENIFFDIARLPDTILQSVGSPHHPVFDELVILILVLLIFLCRVPDAVIPFLSIPIALILALAPIVGGIAVVIGMIIDAAVVVFSRAEAKPQPSNVNSVPASSGGAMLSTLKRISRPSFFALVVVALSFLPAFTPLDDATAARVLEVTPQVPAHIVWEMNMNGQESYRTIHLPSLYPGVQW